MRFSINFTAALVLCLAGLVIPALADSPNDIYWSDEYLLPGYIGEIFDGIEYNGEIVVSGDFQLFDNKEISNVAAFDGTGWRSIDPPYFVRRLHVWQDLLVGTGDKRVCTYDGTGWQLLSNTLPHSEAYELAIYHDELYVGGDSGLYKWNGNGWDAVITRPTDSVVIVSAMAVYNDLLYISGDIRLDDDLRQVYSWDGSTLELVSTLGSKATDMIVYDGMLVMIGGFVEIDGVARIRVAAFDGSEWHSLGEGLDGMPYYIEICNNRLVVSMNHWTALESLPCLLEWDGTSWLPVTEYAVRRSKLLFSANDKVFFIAPYTDPVSDITSYLTSYDGVNVEPVFPNIGFGVNDRVSEMTKWHGDLVIAGKFNGVGSKLCGNVARFDGSEWHSLNYNLSPTENYSASVVTYRDELYITGSPLYTTTGSADILRLVGEEWIPIAEGLTTAKDGAFSNHFVYADELYFFGRSFELDGVDLGKVFKWDGSNISSVSLPEEAGSIQDMEEFEGDLILACRPEHRQTRIYRWNGTDYQTMGDVLSGDVYDMHVFNGELYITGSISCAAGWRGNDVAKWNGSTWIPAGGGFDKVVYSMVDHQGYLYACGQFSANGDVPCMGVARWNGYNWSHLGSGVEADQAGYCFTIESYNDQLFVGGEFLHAGGKVSCCLAVWTQQDIGCCLGLTGNIDGDPLDMVSLGDLSVLIDHLFISLNELPCPAEANLDDDPENVSLGDLTALIDHLFISLNPLPPCP